MLKFSTVTTGMMIRSMEGVLDQQTATACRRPAPLDAMLAMVAKGVDSLRAVRELSLPSFALCCPSGSYASAI